MPVLVTPVSSRLGHLLVGRLLDEGGQVRAVAQDGVGELRGRGAIVANAAPDDPGRLEAAMAQVHTVVHLPTLLLREGVDSLVEEARIVAEAAVGAGVRRLLLRSLLGAADDAQDPLRRALARVEAVYAALPLPTVVVRTGLVDETELRAVLAGTPLPRAVRDVPAGAVAADDVVEVLARLDAARSTATQGHVVFAAPAANRETIGALVDAWQREGQTAVYLDPATAPLLHAALAGPWRDEGETLDVWEFTDLTPRSTGVGAAAGGTP